MRSAPLSLNCAATWYKANDIQLENSSDIELENMNNSGSTAPSDKILARLQKVFGEDRAQLVDGARFRVWNEESRIVASPHNTDELSEVLKLAAADNLSLIPAGAGTWLDMGNHARACDLIVSTAKMSRVLEYEPADLTTTLEAGCTLAAFNRKAAEDKQFIPIDPFGDDRSTIGGTIATGSYGPIRCAYGTPRDWLIGLRIVHADGQITSAGGKVVKNVAGYDLCKLYTGSFGTLGIIAEMSFKLRALPSDESSMIFYADTARPLCDLIGRIQDSDLSPSAMELISHGSMDLPIEPSGFALAIRFLSETETALWQQDEAIRLGRMGPNLNHKLMNAQESDEFWRRYRESEVSGDWETCLRISSLPAALPDTLAVIDNLLSRVHTRAHAANGTVRVLSQVVDSEVILELRNHIQQRGGSLVLLRASDDLKRRVEVWGDAGPSVSIMRQIKDRFDPQGRLNPGRFIAGI